MPLNVMLVEDQELMRMGIQLAVQKVSNSRIAITAVAENGEEAVQKYSEIRPDVVLMDIRMPVMGGIEASKQIRAQDKNAKIIFLTNNNSIEDVFSAFSAGASGYCLKDVEPSMLVNFIDNANHGGISIDPRIAGDMLRFLTAKDAMPDLRSTAQMYDGNRLNARDAEVLRQLIDGSSMDKMSVNTKLSIINILNKISSLGDTRGTTYDKSQFAEAASRKFEFLELLGKGGMGTVYKARNKATDELVALKIFDPNLAVARQRFLHEASIMTKLSHDSVVRVLDYFVDPDDSAYLVMELVDGPSLMSVIECGGAIIEKEAVPIFIRCADALEHLHRAGVIHRDIKPNNIILFSDDEHTLLPKIVDFGVSKSMSLNARERLTLQGEVLGSPLYMSPEQSRGGDVSPRSDIYSMGCVMFEVLCGSPPFAGENYFETMTMHARSPLPKLREWMSPKHQLSSGLLEIVEKCLRKSPDERFQTADELVLALKSLVQND